MAEGDEELLGSLTTEISTAIGVAGDELSKQRDMAMEYYLGMPMGFEVEGRSQVVMTDVMEVVDWILPELMRILSSGGAVEFQPIGPEDDEAARQQTEFVEQVMWRDNSGFMVLLEAIKDALIQKNAFIKVTWCETTHEEKESYEGLNDLEVAQLSEHKDFRIDSLSSRIEEVAVGATPDGEVIKTLQELHDVEGHYTHADGHVLIEALPPEEVLVNRGARTMSTARFVAHYGRRTATDLLEMGVEQSVIDDLPTSSPFARPDTPAAQYDGTSVNSSPMPAVEDASSEYEVYECYFRTDYNGDGRAELVKVLAAGQGLAVSKILLPVEEVGACPIVTMTPLPMPHKLIGRGVAEIVMDLQKIRSKLMRNLLDNMEALSRGRFAVLDGANMDDLLDPAWTGVVRMQNQGDVTALDVPVYGQFVIPALEYLDRSRERRSGVNELNQGVNAGGFATTKGGLEQVLKTSNSLLDLIARVFGETGIKATMLKIAELLQKHQRKERYVKLRGKWVPMDPRQWRKRSDITVNVGVGTINRSNLAADLVEVMSLQERLLQGGMNRIASEKNVYEALSRFVNAKGFRGHDLFFTNPESLPPPEPPPPSPEQMRAQAEVEASQAKTKLEEQKLMLEMERLKLEREKAQMQAQIEQQRLQIEAARIEISKVEAAAKMAAAGRAVQQEAPQ